MGVSLLVAFGLMLLLEGVVPLLFPQQWRDIFARITQFSDGQIRFFGLMAFSCGLAILAFAHWFA